MDLRYSEDYEAFRQEIRDFISKYGDRAPRGARAMAGKGYQAIKDWQQLLIEHGYAARTVPQKYGGYGAEPDVLKSRIIAEEFTAAKMPPGIANQGVSMLVPTLLEMGSEEQKLQYVEPTIKGDIIWCQGYSEPGAGSDLAALKTHAVEDGSDFIINGQKIWTSTAKQAQMMFALVRTEPGAPKHHGISYILIPTDTPGIDIRPLQTMTGRAEFNEVFFTDVRVPQANVVGERGQGWMVANATLKHERGMLGDPNQASTRLANIADMMKQETISGERLIDNPVFRDRLMAIQGRVLAMKFNGLRNLTSSATGAPADMARMVVKLQGTELNHDLAALAIDVMGELGLLYEDSPYLRDDGSWQANYMFDLGLIIGGGTSQIQKNIISERGRKRKGHADMEFALSEEQEMLADSVHRYLEDRVPLDRVREIADAGAASATDVWGGLKDLGVMGILIPEEFGGLGLGLLEAALVQEQLGYHVTPAPYMATAIMAPIAIMQAGSNDQQADWLPKIAAGDLKVGIAAQHIVGEREGAAVSADGDSLSGKSLFVLDADQADQFLVAAAGDLYMVDKSANGLTIGGLKTIDKTRTVGELTFDKVKATKLDGGNRGADAIGAMIDAGRVALAADALGAGQCMLDQAVEYAKGREQFNRVIASFQAVKHMCAEMAAELEPCRAFVWYAAYARDEVPEEAHLMAAQVKAHLAEVTRFVARTATEVHGGMGFTDLVGLHYWFKRIGFNRQILGTPEQCRNDAAIEQGFAA
ncbi:fadE17 [Symbiodinium microadriaticum]|nr:fadE17 [Symbiodinium microadriaticum]